MSVRNNARNSAVIVAALWAIVAGCSNPDSDPPFAFFRIFPPYGLVGTEFTVDASRSTDDDDALNALQVRWDWNDDDTWDTEFTTEKTMRRRYDVEGTFPIRLEVRDTNGLTDTTRNYVHVFVPTMCTAEAAPASGAAPLTVTFSGIATGSHDIFVFRWDFADGAVDSGEVVAHTFAAPGSYDVVLSVVDVVFEQPDCLDTVRVEVGEAPAARFAP
ncbi:MAG: PKD domain-containing protein [bacterium]